MSRKSLAQIEAQIAKLQQEAQALRARATAQVVADVRAMIAQHGLTAADLGLDGSTTAEKAPRRGRAEPAASGRKAGRAGAKARQASAAAAAEGTVAKPARARRQRADAAKGRGRSVGVMKYRDDQGHTWTGRGKRPRWFLDALAAGKTAQDLLINPAA